MIQKIGVALLCACSIFSTSTFSATNHVFMQGLTVDYEIKPNEPQVFSNIFFWTIKAVCTVISEAPDNSISVKMLKKTGSINGIPLTAGDTTELVVHPGDKLYITANSGANVELTNQGIVSIHASCATN
jgi:hypothetical protein